MADSAIGPIPRSDWTCTRSFVSQYLFQSHSTSFCVRPQTDTATAARRCTKLCHDFGCAVRTSMSRWALVLLRRSRCFQVLRPAVPRKSSHFLQLTDHESLFKWHAVQRSCFLNSILRENDVLVCHWRFANPGTMAPLRSRLPVGTAVCLYITLSPNGNTWLLCVFHKNTHKRSSPFVCHLKPRQAPCCVSNQPRFQDAVARQFFFCRKF